MRAAKQLRAKRCLTAAVLIVAAIGFSFHSPPARLPRRWSTSQPTENQATRRLPGMGIRRHAANAQRAQRGRALVPRLPHCLSRSRELYLFQEEAGKFRDGAVIVKELVGIGAKEASSGKGYFMGNYIGLETAVKDSKRFKDEPGNWGYFSFGHKYPLKKETERQSTAACNSCHQNNAATDWVFSQYYPVPGPAPASK